jgi:anti-repressor protein
MAKIYKFKDEFEVRVQINNENEPWFHAKDVCDILGIVNPTTSLKHLRPYEKSFLRRTEVGLPPGRPMVIVNESGLYKLIMKSRKEEAIQFQRWVTHEVLPEIRKTGAYVHDEEGDTEEMIIAKGRPRSLSWSRRLRYMEQTAECALSRLEEGLVEWQRKTRPSQSWLCAPPITKAMAKFEEL